MAKPPFVVYWATDTLVSAGPEAGQPTKVDPAGASSQGWVAGRAAPARWLNFILNNVAGWNDYLSNINHETDFLSEDFHWTGPHIFDGDVDLDGATTISGTLSVTAPDVSISGLRSPGMIGLSGTTNEIIYTDGAGAASPRPRVVMVNPARGTCDAGGGGVQTAVFAGSLLGWTFREASGTVTFPLEAPRGSALTQVRIGVHNPTGGSLLFDVNAFGLLPNKTTPGSPGGSGINNASQSVAAGTGHVFSLSLAAITNVDNSTASYFVDVDGQLGGKIMWVELTYQDPGARNG